MTDTDSFMLEIHTHDFYADIMGDVDSEFDTSNFSKPFKVLDNCDFPVGRHKKILGKMKDELGGQILTEFAGVGAKNYYLSEGDRVEKMDQDAEEFQNL